MEELFEKAEKEGLWFWNALLRCWINPDELKKALENGQFKTSHPLSWRLRYPEEMLEALAVDVRVAQERLRDAESQVTQWRKLRGL